MSSIFRVIVDVRYFCFFFLLFSYFTELYQLYQLQKIYNFRPNVKIAKKKRFLRNWFLAKIRPHFYFYTTT